MRFSNKLFVHFLLINIFWTTCLYVFVCCRQDRERSETDPDSVPSAAVSLNGMALNTAAAATSEHSRSVNPHPVPAEKNEAVINVDYQESPVVVRTINKRTSPIVFPAPDENINTQTAAIEKTIETQNTETVTQTDPGDYKTEFRMLARDNVSISDKRINNLARKIEETGAEGLFFVLDKFKDTRSTNSDRWVATAVLASMKLPSYSADILAKALSSEENIPLRRLIVNTLAEYGTEDMINVFKDILKNTNEDIVVKLYAAYALAKRDYQEGFSKLYNFYTEAGSANYDIKVKLIEFMGDIQSPKSFPFFKKIVRTETDPALVISALQKIISIDEYKSIQELEWLLENSEDAEITKTANQFYTKILQGEKD